MLLPGNNIGVNIDCDTGNKRLVGELSHEKNISPFISFFNISKSLLKVYYVIIMVKMEGGYSQLT